MGLIDRFRLRRSTPFKTSYPAPGGVEARRPILQTEAQKVAFWAQERRAGRGQRLPEGLRPHVAAELVRMRSERDLRRIDAEAWAKIWISELDLDRTIAEGDPARRRQAVNPAPAPRAAALTDDEIVANILRR